MRAFSLTVATTLALAISAVALSSAPAAACGGFFCSQLPMDQAGERIIFATSGETVSAIIQIDYQGEADDFGWVVPVSAVPTDLDVAPLKVFDEMDWRTAPQYWLQWDLDDQECGYQYSADSAESGTGGGDANGGVDIVLEEEVGPYNVTVLSGDDPQELLDWLNDNGFDQPGESVDLIAHYLDIDFYFAAVKLKRGADVGEIQPLRIDLPAERPCVPLVLTRIATQPNMPVYAWIMGDTRAVPINWFNVIINEKKIDWIGYGQNYVEVATEAVDQAAGRGFITEYAGSLNMDNALYSEGQYDLEQLASYTSPAQFLDEMLWMGFPRDAQIQSLIKKHIPKPDDLGQDCDEDNEFYNWNKEECFEHMPADWTFDPVAFVAELEERVVLPLQATQALVDANPYTTRLFTTVSDYEMTRDPMFDFNPDLPDVSNQHTASATGKCSEDGSVFDIVITLESGHSFSVEGEAYPWGGWSGGDGFVDPAPEEPTAERIERMDVSGQPTVVPHDQVLEEDAAIALVDYTHVPLDEDIFADAPEPSEWEPVIGDTGGGDTGGDSAGGDSGCTSGSGDSSAVLFLLFALLAALGATARPRARREDA